jgi:phage tail-like protein
MRKIFAVAVCCILFGSVAQAPAQPPTQMRSSKHATVAIDGVQVRGLRSVTELTGMQEKSDLGRQESGTLVLARAATNDESLREWHKNVVEGRKDRRSVDITFYNEQNQPVRTYHFTNCWPIRYSGPGEGAQRSGTPVEKIELTYESVQVK